MTCFQVKPTYSIERGSSFFSNGKEAKDAFLKGVDFCLSDSGKYCSIRDFSPGNLIEIVYSEEGKTIVLVIPSVTSKTELDEEEFDLS